MKKKYVMYSVQFLFTDENLLERKCLKHIYEH